MTHPAASGERTPLMIIGLGNEFLSDDGLGIRVVRALKERLPAADTVFEELSVGGLQLLDYITGCEHCIIIDAITTGKNPAGTPYRFIQTTADNPPTLTSSHQIDLAQVVTLAALMGAELPRRLTVYGIEADDVTTFHDGCTEAVSRAIPHLVDVICSDIADKFQAPRSGTEAWQIISEAVPD